MEANVLGTAFRGVLLLVLVVLWIVFCVMLVIAPLMIWRWSKNTCAAIEALKASVTSLEKHLLAAHTQSLAELRLIREASKPVGRQPRPPTIPPTVPPPEAIAADFSNTQVLAKLLFTDYAYPFELASLILLVAMIAAVALTLRHRSGTRRQNARRRSP